MSSFLRATFAASVLAIAVSACSVAERLTPYRMDVRQGNFVSQSMLAQLTPGMTQDQVRFVMGSPLLVDIFHPDRWDYVYRFSPDHGPVEQRHVSLLFKDGKLASIEGDVVPATGQAKPQPVVPRVIEIKPESK